jgi:ribosomal protein S18 acetylase RimI-like enzyme
VATDLSRTFSIRHCRAADAEMIAALAARLFTESYGPTHPEPELSRYLARSFPASGIRAGLQNDEVFLVAEDAEGSPLGYASMRPSPEPPDGVSGERAVEIMRFYVDGAHQGRGVGAALMEECFDDAAGRGADVIWLQVWKEAPWAIGFYSRMGFTVVGSTLFHFGEQIGHDHIMSRPVAPR